MSQIAGARDVTPLAGRVMITHFAAMADYNRWANARLFADVRTLSVEAQTRDVGIYFGSAFATLVHALNTDRAWTYLLQGGELDHLPPPEHLRDFSSLQLARTQQDDLIVDWIARLDPDWPDGPFHFTSGLGSLKGMVYHGTRGGILTHLFNHQTHHRGQVHAALTILGVKEPNGLDILIKGFLNE